MASKTAEEWHGWDTARLEKLHLEKGKSAATKGCLSPHQAPKMDHHCSYHWQALSRAKGQDSARYKWPSPRQCKLQPPNIGDWDPAKWTISQPRYPKEAHHIVPFESLTVAICMATSGDRKKKKNGMLMELRGGLLKNGYNINDQSNMIYLPGTRQHARALQLAYHQGRHGTYSSYVEDEIVSIFDGVQEAIQKHMGGDPKEPNYKRCVKLIQELAKDIHGVIIDSRLPKDRDNGDHDTLRELANRLRSSP